MDDFLYLLKMHLADRIPPAELEYQLERYENYYRAQLSLGNTPNQILKKLGDPAKVAELISKSLEENTASTRVHTSGCRGVSAHAEAAGENSQYYKQGVQSGDSGIGSRDAAERGDDRGDSRDDVQRDNDRGGSRDSMQGGGGKSSPPRMEGYGFSAEFDKDKGWDLRFAGLRINTWYGTLIILGIVLAIFILLSEAMK